jgi:GR25 family glycosyltransferase involved in LPS biosynthesis
MNAYLINLDGRPDRLSSATVQLHNLGINFRRIPAISPDRDFAELFPFVTPGIAAIWLSHMKALSTFLATEEEFALILEDDFEIKVGREKFYEMLATSDAFDFLQIGFLVTNAIDAIQFIFHNLKDFFLKTLNKFSKTSMPFSQFIRSKYLVYDQDETHVLIVKHNVRAGAHAYVVNREFAQVLLQLNRPIIFSTDQFYISLATMRSFKMARVRKSIVSQSSSQSSIQKRFTSQKPV